MKKKILSIVVLLFLVIPCTLVFSACGKKDKTTNETSTKTEETPAPVPTETVTLSGVSADLSKDGVGFDYNVETKTFNYEYGTEVDIDKDDFNMIASYSDDSLKIVGDYTLDTTEVSGTPNVGDYKIKLKYGEKQVEFNVHIYPKTIEKPQLTQTSSYTYYTNLRGESVERTVKLDGFDENTMQYGEGSVFSASNVGSYKIKVSPKANYVWETYSKTETEEIVFSWEIKRKTIYMNSPETLTFDYQEGTTHTINFTEVKANQNFSDYFEVSSGVTSASVAGDYEFTVKLKDEFIQNYEIYDINYHAIDGDIEYNADKTQVTYHWTISE